MTGGCGEIIKLKCSHQQNMKNTLKLNCIIIMLILCTFGNSVLSAQKNMYNPIKMKGTITFATSGKHINKGQKFKATDALKFSSTKDFIFVINENEETFLLTPDASLRKYKVKSLTISGSTRPGYILTDMQLRQFLYENDSLLLLNGQFRLILGKEAFPMDETHFFYLQYLWKGDTINKKLTHQGDTLILNAEEIYKIDDKQIDPKDVSDTCFLYYYKEDSQESTAYPALSVPIYIVLTSNEELQEEVKVLLGTLGNISIHDMLVKVDNYLSKFYGRVGSLWELEEWLKSIKH
jgi:hypothetical protein